MTAVSGINFDVTPDIIVGRWTGGEGEDNTKGLNWTGYAYKANQSVWWVFQPNHPHK